MFIYWSQWQLAHLGPGSLKRSFLEKKFKIGPLFINQKIRAIAHFNKHFGRFQMSYSKPQSVSAYPRTDPEKMPCPSVRSLVTLFLAYESIFLEFSGNSVSDSEGD